MNNKELVDIYDENKNKTGKIKLRYNGTLQSGEYIIGVQAIIMNCNRQILISQRSSLKDKLPLKWECNGGALLKGENILDGLVREIYEELGITLLKEEAIYLKTVKHDYQFKEIYLFEKDVELDEFKFTDGEVCSAKWISIEEFMDMFNNGDIVYNVDFDDTDYKKCLELLNK